MALSDGLLEVEKSLWQWARVDTVISATQFQSNRLQGYADGYFDGWTCYVTRDTRSTPAVTAAPQREQQIVTTFTQQGGVVTHPAYTVPMLAGDEILMLHPDISTTVAAAITTILASLTSLGISKPPLVELFEGWQDGAIDLALWTITDPVAGAPWAAGVWGESMMATCSPAVNRNCRLRSNSLWIASPDNYGPNKIVRRFILEFEANFANVANLDNVNFFLGLTPNVGDTRASMNILGWSLVGAGNALQTLGDAGGAETVFTGFGENLVLTNKFRMEVFLFAAPGVGRTLFYLNDALIATHVFNSPSNAPMYLNFYAPTGAGGAATIRLGIIRAWVEDIAR